jgi:succinate dehydrogenase/fumarate reductase flavoprotein subunit
LRKTFEAYNAAAASQQREQQQQQREQEEEGAVLVKDEFGKTTFPVSAFSVAEELYVANVTPVIHYTMGGVKVGWAPCQGRRSTSSHLTDCWVA